MRNRIWGKHLKRAKMLKTVQNERARRRSSDHRLDNNSNTSIHNYEDNDESEIDYESSNHNDENEDGLFQVATRVFTSCEI